MRSIPVTQDEKQPVCESVEIENGQIVSCTNDATHFDPDHLVFLCNVNHITDTNEVQHA